MSAKDKEMELLRLKIQLLETQLQLERAQKGISPVEDLRMDKPNPIVVRNLPSSGYIPKDVLEKLSPGELFILAKQHGVDLRHIFPI